MYLACISQGFKASRTGSVVELYNRPVTVWDVTYTVLAAFVLPLMVPADPNTYDLLSIAGLVQAHPLGCSALRCTAGLAVFVLTELIPWRLCVPAVLVGQQ